MIKKGNVLEDIHRRYIMYQLFRATKYLHSGSVIHRDLKVGKIITNFVKPLKFALNFKKNKLDEILCK